MITVGAFNYFTRPESPQESLRQATSITTNNPLFTQASNWDWIEHRMLVQLPSDQATDLLNSPNPFKECAQQATKCPKGWLDANSGMHPFNNDVRYNPQQQRIAGSLVTAPAKCTFVAWPSDPNDLQSTTQELPPAFKLRVLCIDPTSGYTAYTSIDM